MDYSTLQEQIEAQTAAEQEVDPLSLYSALEAVVDGRKARGLRYKVALILTLIILGKLAGAKTLGAVAHWVQLRTESLLKQLPTSRDRFPCEAT